MNIKNKFIHNKKGIFGLTAIQQFFAIILGVALLAYLIVIIMGVLSTSTILPSATGSIINESVTPTTVGTALSTNGAGCAATITNVFNGTTTTVINAGNYTVSGCSIANTTNTYSGNAWKVTYSYISNSVGQNNLNGILTNTSTGITSFFGAINPVYAILAVLVIILVLVVLVRVVQGGKEQGSVKL